MLTDSAAVEEVNRSGKKPLAQNLQPLPLLLIPHYRRMTRDSCFGREGGFYAKFSIPAVGHSYIPVSISLLPFMLPRFLFDVVCCIVSCRCHLSCFPRLDLFNVYVKSEITVLRITSK